MNLTQCRMARAALGWSLDDLAAASSIGRRTIAKFEACDRVSAASVAALRKAMEGEGLQFLDGGRYAGGVVPSGG